MREMDRGIENSKDFEKQIHTVKNHGAYPKRSSVATMPTMVAWVELLPSA